MRYNPTERMGIHKSAIIFTKEMKWIFREQPIADVGIDALIEESLEGNPTGRFLAAQVKTGTGNFLPTGNSLILYVSRIHYKYWLDLVLPIILLAYIPEDDKVYWQVINEKNLIQTKKRWKLEISKNKILGENSKSELIRILYSQPQDDFITQFKTGEMSEKMLLDIVEESKFLNMASESLENLSSITVNYIEKQEIFNKELNFCLLNGFSREHPKVKSSIKQFSQIIHSTSFQFEKEIDVFSDSFATGFQAFEKLSFVSFYLTNDHKNLEINFERLKKFESTINPAIENLKLFKHSISAFPSNYPLLKIAKTKFVETLNLMIAEFRTAQEMSLNFQEGLKK